MGSNQRETQNGQKARIERKLKERLDGLAEEGMEPREIAKDRHVKKMKADIRAINVRLRAIDATEKKTEELARIKAEKAAAPPKDPESKKAAKAKEAPVAAKEKKKKKE